VILASLGIIFYIAFAFRKVEKPASPWRFGVAAIIALLHDLLVVLGIFAILGHFFSWAELDAMFITALLTILGFSVHDTIVVFDRIRENLRLYPQKLFEEVVNSSLLQTLSRSINTSLVVIITLLTLFILGGETIKGFILALLIGIVSGTYSSIFNASLLIVSWQKFIEKRALKKSVHSKPA
jgi:preprotein translocase subunit SecF